MTPRQTPCTAVPARLLALALLPAIACAQATAPVSPTASTPAAATSSSQSSATGQEEAIIELSPFEVRADGDVGYQAANTTSGSRLNSRLKDTPSAISPFTPEFLSDIAATNLSDMLGYATNIEMETEDATNGFNNPEGRLAVAGDFRFRMRGIAAGSSRDFVDSSIPVDLYNVERAEVSSGPNSILFGLGQAGGNVSLTGKRANLVRNRTTVSNVYGSWQQERLTVDHNEVLVPRLVSLRLLGLYENSEGWRHWDFSDQKRFGGALAVRPFKKTTVHASFENGNNERSITVNWNAVDSISRWLEAGRPIADGAAVTGTTRINQTNQRYTFIENDGIVANMRGELQSASVYATETLASGELSPYAFNTTGPGGRRWQTFRSHSLVVEQRIGDSVTLELGYFHNYNDSTALGCSGQPRLYGDPNLSIPPASFVGSMPNSRAGQFYMEDVWDKDRVIIENDVLRLTAAWEKNFGKWWGRHRIAGLAENSRADRLRYWKTEVFIDQNQMTIGNSANPEGGQNAVNRRHYLVEGDFTTYYVGDASIPAPSFTLGAREFHPTYVSRTKTNAKTFKEINSGMLASQSFWFGGRLVTTAGYRRDHIRFKNANEARVTDPNDPRVLSKRVALNEWDFDGTYRVNHYTPTTLSLGAVGHVTNRLSLFYNHSTNVGTPRFDRTVLPNGDVPKPVEGRSNDYGVMFDLFGDDRYFIRATRFDTAQIGDAPIIPGGIGVNTAGALGGDNLLTIYGALLNAGKITQADYDRQYVTYNAGTVDVVSDGIELELVANPTRNLTLRLGYSHSNRTRANIFSEIFAYYETKAPEWRRLAAGDPALLATIDQNVATVMEELDSQLTLQSGPLGSRPDKWNATGRYKFTEGRLRGAFAGGALRYQGKNTMSYNRTTGEKTYGNETLFGDAFVGYKRRAPFGKGTITLQLNVRNVSDSYRVVIGRRNTAGDGIRRIYLNEPRSYRYTMTWEF